MMKTATKTKPKAVKSAPIARSAPPKVDKSSVRASGDVTRDVERLFQDGVLIDLNIGFWTARRRNTPEELGLKREELKDNVVGLGTKRLIPKKMQDEWLTVISSARYAIRKNAFLFPVGDAWFLPLAMLPKVEARLLELQAEFFKFKEVLAENFATIRRDMIKEDPTLEGQYPSKDAALGMFYFTWSAFTVTLPKKVGKVIADREAVAERAAAQIEQERAAHAAQQRYEAALQRRIDEFLEDAVTTLRAKTAEICRDVAEQIVKGEVVTNRSLTRLRNYVEQFKAMNFVGDQEVEQRINTLLRTMGSHDAEAFDNDRLRSELVGALNSVQQAAAQVSDISDVTGTYRRKIVL